MMNTAAPPPREIEKQSERKDWTLTHWLGVEDCCTLQLGPVKKDAVQTPAQERPETPAVPTKTEIVPPKPESKQQQSGFFAGLAKSVTDAIAQRAAVAENERRSVSLEKQVQLLKGGVLLTRHMPGEASKPVWLSLVIEEDKTSAQIEWRSPQLILNRPVGKQSLQLDQVRVVRAPSEADAAVLPKGGAGCKKDVCIVIVTDTAKIVFEFLTEKDHQAWLAALQEALSGLVPQLHENLQKKLQDERRRKEIEERKQSRDARREKYAEGGMNFTAKIMAGIRG